MKKYIFFDFNENLIEIEISQEISDFLKEDEKRINSEERQIRRYLVQFNDYSFNDFQLPLVPSAEEVLFERLEEEEYKQSQVKRLQEIYTILDTCTPVQKRRFLMYTIGGMTYREIATAEKVNFSKIQKSIHQVIKKLRKCLK